MDLMFEDEVDEVGSDVEAYCPKCKADTTHVVISKYEDEIRRVQCNPCGDVHSFRKPRGDAEDDVPEPVAARKRALLKKPTYEEFFAKKKTGNPAPYQFRQAYREHDVLTHPKFGVGFVSEVVSDSKVEATFQDGRRILVHNRKDLPGIPKGDGLPTQAADKAGKGKAKATAEKAAESKGDKQGASADKKGAAKSAPAKAAVVKPTPAKAAPAPAKTAAKSPSDKPSLKGKPPAKAKAKAAPAKAAAKKPAGGTKKRK